jgi:hypothetical protein
MQYESEVHQMPDSVTQIRNAGPVGSKRNLAVLGDGFTDADQTSYNNWVQDTVLGGVFANDYFYAGASPGTSSAST